MLASSPAYRNISATPSPPQTQIAPCAWSRRTSPRPRPVPPGRTHSGTEVGHSTQVPPPFSARPILKISSNSWKFPGDPRAGSFINRLVQPDSSIHLILPALHLARGAFFCPTHRRFTMIPFKFTYDLQGLKPNTPCPFIQELLVQFFLYNRILRALRTIRSNGFRSDWYSEDLSSGDI